MRRVSIALALGLGALTAGGASGAHAAVLPSQTCPPFGGVPAVQLGSNQVKACSPDELVALLRAEPPFEGRVVIPRDVSWNLSRFQEVPLRSNLTLIGERGELASRPLLYTDIQLPRGYHQFVVTGRNVRFEGIHLKGPKLPAQHTSQTPYVDGIQVRQDAENQLGREVVIADNEFSHWSSGAVALDGIHENVQQAEWDKLPEWKSYAKSGGAGIVSVERNYMHHNVMHNGGYGVVVSGGGWATVTGNVFETNRHAVAATGRAQQGYDARFNYVLEGGYKQGYTWNQHFDVHGSTESGTNKGYGGAAGTKFEIAYNTVRGEQDYYCVPIYGCQTRPAFMLRGTPTDGAFFHDNVLVHDDKDEAVALNGRAPSDVNIRRILPTSERQFNFKSGGNAFDKDYTREILPGDFDGDGRTDVFLAAGTGWFISRAGIRPWEFIRASNKTKRDLALADIDNDKITDVLYRDSAGNLGFVKSGRAANVTPLTNLPVPIKDLRFGDFDGDSRLDMFYTQNKQWRVSYGRSLPRRFVNTATSVSPIEELLFGDFDDVRGTDVAAVKKDGWMYSSASTGSYTKLNSQLTKSFRGAVAADFDGNGRIDIGFNGDEKWAYARSGRGPARLLRADASTPIQNVIFGQFDRNPRAQAITYDSKGLSFVGWGGLGSGNVFKGRSTQKMR